MVNIIWIILVLFAIWFIYVLGTDIIKHKNNLEKVYKNLLGILKENTELKQYLPDVIKSILMLF